MIKNKILLIIILFLEILFFSPYSRAQNLSVLSISIFPEKFDLELERGEAYKEKIRISNLSQSSLSINIQIKNFSATGEKGEVEFSEEDEDISFNPRQWIKFGKKNFVLEPNGNREIEFSIKVPENTEAGGYYATAFFQTEIPSAAEKSSARIVSSIGALFLIKIKGGEEKYPALEKQFELVEIKAPDFIESGPIKIDFRVKNNDPVHVKVGGKLILYDLFGKVREKIKIEPKTILPGKIRFFEVKTSGKTFSDNFFIGPYKGELILATPLWRKKIGNDRQLVKNIKFYGFPWKIFLTIIIFFIFLIFSIKILKKSQKKSQNSVKHQ